MVPRILKEATRFQGDVERMKARQKNMEKLKDVVRLLVAKKRLPPELYDHPLHGNYADCRECHLENDWLLIYRIERPERKGDPEILRCVRTGTHSDLFKK